MHYVLHRRIGRLTNPKIFTYLFGDSSLIVYYLRYIGYNLNRVVQTGSNFGDIGGARKPLSERCRQRHRGR